MSVLSLLEEKVEQNIHNFSAGPCILPNEVFRQAAEAVINFNNSGLSILEISHRSQLFDEVIETARAKVKTILKLPSNYEVLFLQGGASYQSMMVPMNFLNKKGTAAYIDTGIWANKSIADAKELGNVRVIGSSKEGNYAFIPEKLEVSDDCDYLHYTSNNTVAGSQFPSIPKTKAPLICDMSSDIFSKEIPAEQFALIYAGAQKNLGPAGATLIIINPDYLGKTDRFIPRQMDYRNHIDKKSMLNTPPCFSVFVSLLTLNWLEKNGGITEMQKRADQRADMVYQEIDRNSLFRANVQEGSRSNMNITFSLLDDQLEKEFLSLCDTNGISGIEGHRSVGGFRASMYNAMEIDSAKALVETMLEFEKKHA